VQHPESFAKMQSIDLGKKSEKEKNIFVLFDSECGE